MVGFLLVLKETNRCFCSFLLAVTKLSGMWVAHWAPYHCIRFPLKIETTLTSTSYCSIESVSAQKVTYSNTLMTFKRGRNFTFALGYVRVAEKNLTRLFFLSGNREFPSLRNPTITALKKWESFSGRPTRVRLNLQQTHKHIHLYTYIYIYTHSSRICFGSWINCILHLFWWHVSQCLFYIYFFRSLF